MSSALDLIRSSKARFVLGVAFGVVMLAGCGREPTAEAPSIPVSVISVVPRNLAVYDEFVGEVRGSQEVELRARVSGILVEQLFQDGVIVQQGQPLFSIDDRDLRSRVTEAEGALASAQSNLSRARLDVERYDPLVANNAISRQVYDNAVATQRAAAAQVESAQAAVQQARLNVEYASIVAPVTGRIGAAEVDEGDLIAAGSTLLATVSNSDPAWVYFSVSESALLDYERRHGVVSVVGAQATQRPVEVRLYMSDGSLYPNEGEITFADRALDIGTGTYRLRAEFPNPEQALRPGMFARIRVTTDVIQDVIVVPDKAVTQLLDRFFLTVVNDQDQAEQRAVKLGRRQEGLWVVEAGVFPDERVVVEGIQRARPGVSLAISVEDGEEYFNSEYLSMPTGQ